MTRAVAIFAGAVCALLLAAGSQGAVERDLGVVGLMTRSELVHCIEHRGGAIERGSFSDPILRTLNDVTRHSAFVVRFGKAHAFVGIAPSRANADLLRELLTSPGATYDVQRTSNVVQVAMKGQARAARAVGACSNASVKEADAGARPRRLAQATAATAPIYTVAGTGQSGNAGDGGQAVAAAVDQPRGIAPLPDGSYLVVEPFQNDIRRVWPDGTITRFAGVGGPVGFSGDGGPATLAQFNFPHAVSVTTSGAVLVADRSNHRIRSVAPDGVITTVAGNGVGGFSGDGGPATQAEIYGPAGVAALPDGGFLIADSFNHRIRRVSANGIITTVAGTGTQGFSGDGGPATDAMINIAFGVSPLADGGFLIVDVGNQRIRRVWPDGTISTVAGNGTPGYTGDGGPAVVAELNNPHNVWATDDGGFLIADASNSAIRYVASDGRITTIAGTGTPGVGADGVPAGATPLAFPKAVAALTSGAVLVADTSNDRVRRIGDPVAPTSISPPLALGVAAPGHTLHATPGVWSGAPSPSHMFQWQRCDASGAVCSDIPSATLASLPITLADVGSTLRVIVAAANAAGTTSAKSSVTDVVTTPSPPVNTALPTITGSAVDGQTLTADPGVWTGSTPLTYAYQWERCNSNGNACVDIAGADARTHTVAATDFGSTLRVRVDASNVATTSAYQDAVTADEPHSYWRLDDAGGALVDQQGTAGGVYMNNPDRSAAGLLAGNSDGGVALDGADQYLDVPGDAAWTSTAFTIEILIKPASLPVNKTIWSAIGPNFTGWWLNTGPEGQLRMFVGDGTGWRYDDPAYILEPGRTYDIVATYDGTNARLYVDGALISTGPPVAMDGAVNNSPLRFGAYSTGPGQFWSGVLDEASFYTSALTAARVAAHYEASSAGAPSASSSATAPATPARPRVLAAPEISGSTEAGGTVNASEGTWAGTTPMSFTYQWQRCDDAGGACTDIAGATMASYTNADPEQVHVVRVVVSAANVAGQASATSAPAPPQTTYTSGPSSSVATSANFTFTANVAGSTFACSLDGRTFAVCESPVSISGLSAGSHTLSVRATDPRGNTEREPAVWRWSVVAAPPPAAPQPSSGGSGGVPPDLRVELSANVSVAPPPGSQVIYFVTVSSINVGASSATLLDVILPAGFAVTRTYSDRGPGCRGVGSNLTCDVAWISPGTSTNVTIWGTVGTDGEQDLTATAMSVVETELKATLTDNSATLKLPTPARVSVPQTRFAAVRPPAVLGSPVVGRTVTVEEGAWSRPPSSVRYRWESCTRRGCAPIPAGVGRSLKLSARLGGRLLRVVEVAMSQGHTVSSPSKAVAVRRK